MGTLDEVVKRGEVQCGSFTGRDDLERVYTFVPIKKVDIKERRNGMKREVDVGLKRKRKISS